MDGNSGEWCVAYHGVGKPEGFIDALDAASNIIKQGLIQGPR
jgi:hypothetical protein